MSNSSITSTDTENVIPSMESLDSSLSSTSEKPFNKKQIEATPRRKMTDKELDEFVTQQKSTLPKEMQEQAREHNRMVAKTMQHILQEKGGSLVKPNELPQPSPGVLLAETEMMKSNDKSSSTVSSSSSSQDSQITIEWSEVDQQIGLNTFLHFCEKSTESSRRWFWSQLSAADQKRTYQLLEDAIDKQLEPSSQSEKDKSEKNEEKQDVSITDKARVDNDLKAKARRIAAEQYDIEKDVHVPIGIYQYVLMSYTGPSARCTTKTSTWALRCWGGFNSAADFEKEVQHIQSINPYALNLDFFALTVGGGKGGAIFPPSKNDIKDQHYTNKELERFMNDHNRELTKSNQVHDERVKNKIDPSPAIRQARENALKNREKRRLANKQFVNKSKKSGTAASETYVVRKSDGSIELKKRTPAPKTTSSNDNEQPTVIMDKQEE